MQMELSSWNKKGLTWINGELLVVVSEGQSAGKFERIESIGIDDNHLSRYSSTIQIAKITTNFCAWTSISNGFRNQSLEVLGFNFEDFNHQFYSFTQFGIEYVVPAFALIKSLIHPRRTLLPKVFKPNFIEDIVCIENVEGKNKISLQRDILNLKITRPVAYIHRLYSWFATHGSATAMINSIHRNARSGRIGIDLPKAIIQAKFKGTQISGVFLVNEIVLNQVEPCEEPDVHLSDFKKVVNLKGIKVNSEHMQFSPLDSLEIPLRTNGGSSITCEEWEIVKKTLSLSDNYLKRFKYCPRLQLSAILNKLHSNLSWRTTDFGESDWRTAATLYRSLKTTGKFEKIINILRELRT